jgi:hypothetical protein
LGVDRPLEALLLLTLECLITGVGVDGRLSFMELSFVVDRLTTDFAEAKL